MPPVIVGARKFLYAGGKRPTAGPLRRIGRVTPKRTSAPGGNGSSAGSCGCAATTLKATSNATPMRGTLKRRDLMADSGENGTLPGLFRNYRSGGGQRKEERRLLQK